MSSSFFYKLNYLFSNKDKKFLFILLLMSLLLSVIETIGITAIMPFISIASNPELIHTNEYYKIVYDFFEITSSKNFIIYFGISLIGFYFFRAIYTLFHGNLMIKFSMNKYTMFTNKLFANYINMPYLEFTNRNSATLSKVIITEASQLAFLVQSVLVLFSEIIIIVILYVLLLIVDIQMTLVLTILLGLKVIFLMMTVSKKIKIKGDERAVEQDKFYRKITETLGNFKIIKFISNQTKLLTSFVEISKKYANINIVNTTLQLVPKSVLEAVGLSTLMGVIIFIVMSHDNAANIIPIISMYALALYRILPAITRVLGNYNNIIFYSSSLDIVYKDISHKYNKEEDKNNINFKQTIGIDNLCFSYNSKNNIIKQLSLKIKKGQKIAFVGESGSGKSTLVDLICGIYRPNSGKILIDGVELDNSNIVSWRKRIGYIPQSIYLFDGTIADNITFGRDYNADKLKYVLKQANIYDLIMEKEGFDTMVGEGGIQLSGGQKQRIGIARALYGDPEILVLDEATSALDTETEQAIMNEIYKVSEDKTLMIIAHRLSTIEKCDVKIDVGKLNE